MNGRAWQAAVSVYEYVVQCSAVFAVEIASSNAASS